MKIKMASLQFPPLTHICPSSIFLLILENLARVESAGVMDDWYVSAHVRANRQTWTNDCYRNGGS